MQKIKIGNYYAGAVDAFGYAANKLGIEVAWQIESNLEAHKYLKHHHPTTKRYYYDESFGSRQLEWVHIITGGDPCQPSSNAGLRRGMQDDRYRWPIMFKGIKQLRPDWVINENVVGTVSNLVLDQKITDLESIGYTCQAFNIPAVGVGAYHKRERIFLIANSNAHRWAGPLCSYPEWFVEQDKKNRCTGCTMQCFQRI